ncbi:MAG TPA: transcriptional repressor [Phycisphaerales bacterium]|nr:transcriptional repressor [Phycisphaerales bacterium]
MPGMHDAVEKISLDERDCECRSEAIRSLFRLHGLRCTRQRELIYSTLAASKTHPTADELFQSVRHEEPGLSLATVYNTLDAFTERGLCRRIPSPQTNGPSRYDTDTNQHVHVMLDDGRVFDVPDDLAAMLDHTLPPSFVEEVERRLGIRLTGYQLHLSACGCDKAGNPSKEHNNLQSGALPSDHERTQPSTS